MRAAGFRRAFLLSPVHTIQFVVLYSSQTGVGLKVGLKDEKENEKKRASMFYHMHHAKSN